MTLPSTFQTEIVQMTHGEVRIHGERVLPKKTPIGAVLLVHGFGEHLGRYKKNVIPRLVASGMGVMLYDNVGHGKSGGKRGHCKDYTSLLDILSLALTKTKESFPGLPVFLYGHSMGGNLILNYALRRKPAVSGLIATSPYLRLAFDPPQWKMILGKLMVNIAPSITLSAGLDAKAISRIPEEVLAYTSDPLVHGKVSPMFSFPIMEAGEWALSHAHELQFPTLLLHGTGDRLIDHKATKIFHERCGSSTLFLYEGGFHELHHDSCQDMMLDQVQAWLTQYQ